MKTEIIIHSPLENREDDKTLFEGTYKDLPAMIKQVRRDEVDIIALEQWLHLNRPSEHQGIVRFYGIEEYDETYYNLAYEKCSCSLHQYLLLLQDSTNEELMGLFRCMISSLAYLHQNSIFHGNLNSKNIMIKDDGNDRIAKICGLEQSSRFFKDKGADTSQDKADLGIMMLSCLVPTTAAEDKELMNREGEEKDRLVYRKLAKLLHTNPEAYDILYRLINKKINISFSYDDLLHHIFFWQWLKRLTYLVDVCEMLKEIKNQDQNSPLLHAVNGLANVVFSTNNWTKEVNKDWYRARDRSTLTKDVYGLLKIIRDTSGHLLELKKPDWDKKQLVSHITSRFPRLIMSLHHLFKFSYPKCKIMKDYYQDTKSFL